MCANVPLAAAVAHDQGQADQGQARHPERSLVSPLRVTSLGEPAWEAFYALVYVATTILVESAPRSPAAGIAAGLAFAAMIPWYLLLGRPVMRLDDEATWQRVAAGWRGPVYLAGIIALFAVADHANPNGWFLAFALSSQCFQVTTPIRRAMAFVIVLNLVGGLTIVLASPTAQNVTTAIGIVLFAIAFSMVYSRWTVRVIEQSRERAVLIAQLESAQAELAVAYHEAGVYAERQRLAAEIHDTLAQGFLSVVTLIQAAQASRASAAPSPLGPGTPDVLGDYLELVVATARENLAEARTLVAALAPASLDDVGLAGAVARAASTTGRAAEIEATCVTEGTARPLPTAIEVVLLRVCQEALTNVRKHAAATRVDIRLRYVAGTVELTVADNGRGFTAAVGPAAAKATAEAAGVGAAGAVGAAGSVAGTRAAGTTNTTAAAVAPAESGATATGAVTGFGLRGMGERLRQVGGTLAVVTAPGAGTTIRAEVPG